MPIALQGSSVWVPIPEERVVKVPNQWYLTKVHKVLAEDRIVILENGVRTDLHFFFFFLPVPYPFGDPPAEGRDR